MKSILRSTAFAAFVFLPIIILTLALSLTLVGSQSVKMHHKPRQQKGLLSHNENRSQWDVFLPTSSAHQVFFTQF